LWVIIRTLVLKPLVFRTMMLRMMGVMVLAVMTMTTTTLGTARLTHFVWSGKGLTRRRIMRPELYKRHKAHPGHQHPEREEAGGVRVGAEEAGLRSSFALFYPQTNAPDQTLPPVYLPVPPLKSLSKLFRQKASPFRTTG
jgi:hypothetical protein